MKRQLPTFESYVIEVMKDPVTRRAYLEVLFEECQTESGFLPQHGWGEVESSIAEQPGKCKC